MGTTWTTREEYEAILDALPAAGESDVPLAGPEVIEMREKAWLIELPHGETGSKRVWFPRSVLSRRSTQHAGNALYCQRWFMSKERLWRYR